MNYIGQIDPNELDTVAESVTGAEGRLEEALTNYNSLLSSIANDGFGPDTVSNTQDSIIRINEQVSKISATLGQVSCMINMLIAYIEPEILEQEDVLAESVRNSEV